MSVRRAGALLLCAACLAGGVGLYRSEAADTPAAPPGQPPGVPVTVITPSRRDVPVYLSGIGTVQALNSVLIRSRVDGTLDSVDFKEGQLVKRGDLLAVIDPRPYAAALDQAEAKKAQDEAMMANAKLDLSRYSTLARSEFASRQSVDTQRATVDQTGASIKGDDAAIEAAALNLSFTHITAPFDGRVGLRMVDPGNLIHANDANGLVTLTQVRPIAVIFTLPEQDLPKVVAAMHKEAAAGDGRLKAIAYDGDDQTRLAEGSLLTPDNTIDTSTGTIKLKAVFPNTEDALWPGQFVTVRLQVGTDRNAVTLPAVAIQRGQDGPYVFVVKPDDTAAAQNVKVPYETDGTAVIAQGLTGGEHVVLSGQSRLSDGVRVAAREASPAQAGAIEASGG